VKSLPDTFVNGKLLEDKDQNIHLIIVYCISFVLTRFANVLHGRHDGFELGAQVSGCTRGMCNTLKAYFYTI